MATRLQLLAWENLLHGSLEDKMRAKLMEWICHNGDAAPAAGQAARGDALFD